MIVVPQRHCRVVILSLLLTVFYIILIFRFHSVLIPIKIAENIITKELSDNLSLCARCTIN